MEKQRLIPFRFLPASWGLKGQAYAEAEAAYYLEGEELDRRLAEIRLADDPVALRNRLLDIDVRYGKKTAFERDCIQVRDRHEAGLDLDLAILDIELKHGKVTKSDYEKRKANLKNEPWVGIKESGYDFQQGVGGMYFEFDWNEAWIEMLRLHGYVGTTDEQVFEQWFADISRSVVEETPDIGSAPLHRRRRPNEEFGFVSGDRMR